MIQDRIHPAICRARSKVETWFRDKSKGLFFPFYSSFDIRDSGFKVVPVDANLFPAGFNNICGQDKETSVSLVREYFAVHHSGKVKKIVLLTEEHTQNPYYWDNVKTLFTMLESAGLEVQVAMPKILPEEPLKIKSAAGFEIEVYSARRVESEIEVNGLKPDLIISNNDFSEVYSEWIQGLQTPINPPHALGWHRRRKSQFFDKYNQLIGEFAELIEEPQWSFQVHTEVFPEFDINSESSRGELAVRVDKVLEKISQAYKERQIKQRPYVFIKNNSGTYGLGVVQAYSGDEIRQWNYKSRKKMKAAKGGGGISQVIIQEGVPTALREENATAEPAIYMIGSQLAGGFLRTHGEKNAEESLNSPGAVYKRLCVSDLAINISGCPMENVYGWVARVGFLAIAQEATESGISCASFKCS